MALSGFINILKPPGMSSHDVVGFVRKVLKEKRVGHAGTLDPAAAGVLPIAIGQAARLIEYLEITDKVYRAEICLGISTDSGDDTGKVLERKAFIMPADCTIENVLSKFRGHIKQVPPAHSAIKIEGRKACDLIRQGVEVEIPTREVVIHRLELLSSWDGGFRIEVECSKGTYIRSLCMDIGEAMEIPALMSFLVRQRVGSFEIRDALTLEEFEAIGAEAILSPEPFLHHLPRYDLRQDRMKAFLNGLSTTDRFYKGEDGPLRVYAGDQFLGIGGYNIKDQSIRPHKVVQMARN